MTLAMPLYGQSAAHPGRHYPAQPATPASGVHSDYDPKFDKTVLQLDPAPLDATLRISALVALDGRKVTKEAPGVVLTFWSTAPRKLFQDKRNVSLVIDHAAPISLGAAFLQPNPRPGYTEILMSSTSLDQWLVLAKARTATLSVGDFSYDLTPELLAAIHDFASRMAPRK
ncbi:MAG: hypothetical protein ACHQSE_03745 [Gemmatimonadales bacterium]